MSVGRRGCNVCRVRHFSGHIEPCYRCGSKVGHHHVIRVDRHGRPADSVAVCDVHGVAQVAQASGEANGAPEAATAFDVGDPRKRWLDKTYRQAVAQLRERHREELDELIHEARGF